MSDTNCRTYQVQTGTEVKCGHFGPGLDCYEVARYETVTLCPEETENPEETRKLLDETLKGSAYRRLR